MSSSMGNWNQVGLSQGDAAQFMGNASNAAHKAGTMATDLAQQVNRNRKTEFDVSEPIRKIQLEEYGHNRAINRRMLVDQTLKDVTTASREEQKADMYAGYMERLKENKVYADSEEYGNLNPNNTVHTEPQYDQDGRALLDEMGQPIVKQYMVRGNVKQYADADAYMKGTGGAIDLQKHQATINENMDATGVVDRTTAKTMSTDIINNRYGKTTSEDMVKLRADYNEKDITNALNLGNSTTSMMMGGSLGTGKGRGRSKGPSNSTGPGKWVDGSGKEVSDVDWSLTSKANMKEAVDYLESTVDESRSALGMSLSGFWMDTDEANRNIIKNNAYKYSAEYGVPVAKMMIALTNKVKDNIGPGKSIDEDLLLSRGEGRTDASNELAAIASGLTSGSLRTKGSGPVAGIGNTAGKGGRKWVSSGPSLAQQKAARVANTKMANTYNKNQSDVLKRGRDERKRIFAGMTRKTKKEILDDLFAPGKARATAYQTKKKAEAAKAKAKTDILASKKKHFANNKNKGKGKDVVSKDVDPNKAKTDIMNKGKDGVTLTGKQISTITNKKDKRTQAQKDTTNSFLNNKTLLDKMSKAGSEDDTTNYEAIAEYKDKGLNLQHGDIDNLSKLGYSKPEIQKVKNMLGDRYGGKNDTTGWLSKKMSGPTNLTKGVKAYNQKKKEATLKASGISLPSQNTTNNNAIDREKEEMRTTKVNMLYKDLKRKKALKEKAEKKWKTYELKYSLLPKAQQLEKFKKEDLRAYKAYSAKI